MADGRDDVLKSLGIGRRSREAGEPEAKGAEAPKTKSSSGPRLGIKRRSGASAEAAAPEDTADGAEVGTEDEASAGDVTGAAAPVTTESLGSDETAVMLRSLFKGRPALQEQIPPRAFGLHRTHGRYIGDGRPERRIVIGWEPSLVIFTVPPYADGMMPKVEREGALIDPPLHRQPTFVGDGFVVDEPFNIAGDWYMYVVFKSDGEPVEVLDPTKRKKKTRRGRGGGPADKKDLRAGLGIKRRS